MEKYRRKPTVIEAEQFFPDKQPWPEGVELHQDSGVDWYVVKTVHGFVRIEPGCWVIPENEPGRAYPVTPDIFEKTYEKVE